VKTDNQKNFSKKQQKPLNKYLKYSGLAFQFLAAMLLGFWIGSWLDIYFQLERPWGTMGSIMILLIATLIKVIRDITNE
jgi:F0F1-type ATP synthase assembly protein I